MSEVLQELIALLSLEKIEENLYRGPSQDLGWGTVFGGQVLGQALAAAAYTAPPDRFVHSLHSYFLRPGDVNKPIVYDVERIRDGGSFTTRRVVAIQSGRPIFSMSASFQIEEVGLEHQGPPPEAPEPDSLLSEQALLTQIVDRIPERWRTRALADRPIEIRPIEPVNILAPRPMPPHQRAWYRATGPLPDDPALHRYLLAYASDFYLLPTSMRPHAVSGFSHPMHIASIDHAMWFHRPFRMDDWLLYVMESPTAADGRGLVRGSFYDRAGRLVASVMQEGLIRLKPTPPKP